MKKFIASLILVLFTVACAQTGMMQSGSMCEKCPCCQGMMQGKMKEGMQCPMMKDGTQCPCCKKMMEGGMDKMKPNAVKKVAPKTDDSADHKAHHPQ